MQEAMSVNAGTIDSLAEQIRAAKLAALGVTAEQAENLNLEAAARLKVAVGPERFAEIMRDGDYVKSPFSPDGMPEPDEVFTPNGVGPVALEHPDTVTGDMVEATAADKADFIRQQHEFIEQQREALRGIHGDGAHLTPEQDMQGGGGVDHPAEAVPDGADADAPDSPEVPPEDPGTVRVDHVSVQDDIAADHEMHRVAAEGAMYGVSEQGMVSQGVLDPGFHERVPMGIDYQVVMARARSLMLQKQAADEAFASGAVDRARSIRRTMKVLVDLTNKRYGGGVFQDVEQIPLPGQSQ